MCCIAGSETSVTVSSHCDSTSCALSCGISAKPNAGSSWLVNLSGILALVEQARADRSRRFGVATFSKARTAA
jgi:hypothetical protein